MCIDLSCSFEMTNAGPLTMRIPAKRYAGHSCRMTKQIEKQTDTLSGAEAAVEMLKAHGVEILFGLCGDTSLPFYDALARLPHGMRHVLARDERSAAYMADGYARVSGKAGVCEGPSGGGVTYILPGLAEANESSVPVLCINSDISVAARGRYTLTEDRKSTRLNSSHGSISYAVFCLKKKKKK